MNALEMAVKCLGDEKLFITEHHLDDRAYLYRDKKVAAYERRIKEIDEEIMRLLSLEFYPTNNKPCQK